jgi:hypothetical protein
MEVYVYGTPDGLIADFRPYLDGRDHSFDPPRPLKSSDPRWETVVNLRCPRTGAGLHGNVEFAGGGSIDDYHELMVFPVAYEGPIVTRPAKGPRRHGNPS